MTASITSSAIISDSPQIDGRRQIAELHVDSLGVQYPVSYLGAQNVDAAAALAARPALLLAALNLAEIAVNIAAVTTLGSLAVPTFNYSIVADNVAALRLAYASATQTQAVMIGDFLSSLTNAQIESAFGLTLGQTTTLRTNKLTPAATLAVSIRASAGQ